LRRQTRGDAGAFQGWQSEAQSKGEAEQSVKCIFECTRTTHTMVNGEGSGAEGRDRTEILQRQGGGDSATTGRQVLCDEIVGWKIECAERY